MMNDYIHRHIALLSDSSITAGASLLGLLAARADDVLELPAPDLPS